MKILITGNHLLNLQGFVVIVQNRQQTLLVKDYITKILGFNSKSHQNINFQTQESGKSNLVAYSNLIFKNASQKKQNLNERGMNVASKMSANIIHAPKNSELIENINQFSQNSTILIKDDRHKITDTDFNYNFMLTFLYPVLAPTLLRPTMCCI